MSQPNFINGNFNLPQKSPNTFTSLISINSNTNNFYNDTSLPNWVVTGNTGANTSIYLYICNGNSEVDNIQLNPNLPNGISQYIGLLAVSTNTTGYINISQTITINTGYYSLSFYIAPSNPSSQYANYSPNNNTINMSISNNVLNSNININPSQWQWNQLIYNIYIPISGNYTFTFQQSYIGPYSTMFPISVIYFTGFNLNLQQVNSPWKQLIKTGGAQNNLDIGAYQQTNPPQYGGSGVVYAFDFDSIGNLYIAGTFTCFAGFNSTSTNNWLGVIKWNGTSASQLSNEYFIDTTVNPSTVVGVQTLIIINDIIYIGGSFNKIGNTLLSGLAKFDLANSVVWEPIMGVGSGVLPNGDAFVSKLYYDQQNQNLYIGGIFSQITDGTNTYTANNVSSINLGTNSINNNTLNIGVNQTPNGPWVLDLLLYNGILYICGFIKSAGGNSGFNNIASWNFLNNSWETQNFQGGITWSNTNDVYTFTLNINPTTNDLYVGGAFNTVGALNQNNLARWNIIQGEWTALPGTLSSNLTNYLVTNIYFRSYNDLFIGSSYFDGNPPPSTPYNGLLQINLDTGNITPYMASITAGGGYFGAFGVSTIAKILIYNNNIYIGGSFSTINNVIINDFSYYQIPEPTDFIVYNNYYTNRDLNTIFQPIVSPNIMANETGFKVNNNFYNDIDLNKIFQPILPYSTQDAGTSVIILNSDSTFNYALITFTSTSSTTQRLNINPTGSTPVTVNYTIVGGGGGGGGSTTIASGGGGGGGGQVKNGTISISVPSIITMTIGQGGNGWIQTGTAPQAGSSTSIIVNNTTFDTASGGSPGNGYPPSLAGGTSGSNQPGGSGLITTPTGQPYNPSTYYLSGGGGGSGGAGTNATTSSNTAGNSGNGGVGTIATTNNIAYGGGGGGGAAGSCVSNTFPTIIFTGGTATNGGGNGALLASPTAVINGTTNTGGGGGGGACGYLGNGFPLTTINGGNGGSGIVIFKIIL